MAIASRPRGDYVEIMHSYYPAMRSSLIGRVTIREPNRQVKPGRHCVSAPSSMNRIVDSVQRFTLDCN
jgi:hypothetical protein